MAVKLMPGGGIWGGLAVANLDAPPTTVSTRAAPATASCLAPARGRRLEKFRRCTRGVWGSSRSRLLVRVPLVVDLVAFLADVCLGVCEGLLVFGFELIAEPLRVS